MLSTISNYHHSKLPAIGEIGYLVIHRDRWGKPMGYAGDRREKVIVEAFPLTDSPDYHYSLGIHTAYFRGLGTGEVYHVAGQFFEAYA